MRGAEVDRTMLEIDNDPVEPGARHDLHGLNAGNGGNRTKGGTTRPPLLAQSVERRWRRGRQSMLPCVMREGRALAWKPISAARRRKASAADQAGTRPPKNGIKAWLSVCGRLEGKIISAPASSDSPPPGLSKSEPRRAIAGAGSIQSTGQGARATSRSISRG